MGSEKGIEKTLFFDGEKLKKEQALARVYEKSGIDIYIYDQKLSKRICERKFLDLPKELTTLTIYYPLEECKPSMNNSVEVVRHKEGISLILQYAYQPTNWKHSWKMNELAEAIKQVITHYKDIGITGGWDDIYHWLVLICKVPKEEVTIQTAISYFLPFVNELNERALSMVTSDD